MSNLDAFKAQAAAAALEYVLPKLTPDAVIGIGTGSTAAHFIRGLAPHAGRFRCAVSSSEASTRLMKELHIPVVDLNEVESVLVYVDGCDETTRDLALIKGGGGALTREKIVASAAEEFVVIADHTKLVDTLGTFPLPVEVIPMARASVQRALASLHGVQGVPPRPVVREGFVTDNGNVILDVRGLAIADPAALEAAINNIPGVVTVGLFARGQRGSKLFLAGPDKIQVIDS